MQITINITDNRKATAFLNFIKSLDFVTVKESDENTSYPTMTEKKIIDRVAVTNKQIKQGETVSHDSLHKESQNW
jgi:flagella basal body P-ring formation protein FlgA